MKGVQCYELFGGIALKNHAFSFSFFKLCETIFVTRSSKKERTIIIIIMVIFKCYFSGDLIALS